MRQVLGLALLCGVGCASNTDPCSPAIIVQTQAHYTLQDEALQREGVVGGHFAVELDNGQRYVAIYGQDPPRTGEGATICDVESKVDGSHHYSIQLNREHAKRANATVLK